MLDKGNARGGVREVKRLAERRFVGAQDGEGALRSATSDADGE